MIRSRINLNKKFSVHLVNTVNTAKQQNDVSTKLSKQNYYFFSNSF